MDSLSAATPYAVDMESLAAERLSSAFPRRAWERGGRAWERGEQNVLLVISLCFLSDLLFKNIVFTLL